MIRFPFGFSLSLLWKMLLTAALTHSPEAESKLAIIYEDASTCYTYGPDIRTFIDNHGNTIRTAGSHADIQNAVHSCDCAQVFPAYIDPSVGHVRTQDTSVLGSTLGPLAALGLNFRPVLTCSNSDLPSAQLIGRSKS